MTTKLREKFDGKARSYVWLSSPFPFEPGLEECRVSVAFAMPCDVVGFHLHPLGEEEHWDVFEHFISAGEGRERVAPHPFPSSVRPGWAWTVRVKNLTAAPRRFCAVLLVEYAASQVERCK